MGLNYKLYLSFIQGFSFLHYSQKRYPTLLFFGDCAERSAKGNRKTFRSTDITQNWRGRPLDSLMVIVNLISHTTTQQGLQVRASLDQNQYKVGIKVSNDDFNAIAITRDTFHGDQLHCGGKMLQLSTIYVRLPPVHKLISLTPI